MSNIVWKYIVPLNENDSVEKYEKWSGLSLPDDLKTLVMTNNAGMPDICVFDTETSKNKVLKGLLSFNESDSENVYEFTEVLRDYGFDHLIPFALDPFGNVICAENEKIVFWDHETKETEHAANSISEFMNQLY